MLKKEFFIDKKACIFPYQKFTKIIC